MGVVENLKALIRGIRKRRLLLWSNMVVKMMLLLGTVLSLAIVFGRLGHGMMKTRLLANRGRLLVVSMSGMVVPVAIVVLVLVVVQVGVRSRLPFLPF